MRVNRHPVYLFCGSIYNMNDHIIENPAILIDKDTGCVHCYGNADLVRSKFLKMTSVYNQTGFVEMADALIMLDFTNAYFYNTNNEEVCYILRRALEYTASNFQIALCEHATKPDFKEWLADEMKRMPLDLSEKEYK